MGISANNFVLLELIKDGSIMYTRKLQATEATTFDYTAPATGEYTWRMRSSSIGTTTTQPLTYSLDNLSIFYTYPYTVENCDNLADGYRFGFNTQEKDDEVYGAGNLNTAMFWEYDTRIGRRWNVDPVYNASESRYIVNGNNPLIFYDPFGDYKTKLGAKIANFFSKEKGEVLQAKTGKHKGEWFRGVADKENGGNLTRVFGGKNESKVARVVDLIPQLTSSMSILGEANINFGELAGSIEIFGPKLGFDFGAGVRLIGVNYNPNDVGGKVKNFGWQSTFRANDHSVDVGGGIGFAVVGMSYRRKWDIKKSHDNWMQQDKLVYNGVVTSIDINTYTNQANLNWVFGGKLSAIIGVDGEVKFNVDMNKFTSTLEEMSKVIKP